MTVRGLHACRARGAVRPRRLPVMVGLYGIAPGLSDVLSLSLANISLPTHVTSVLQSAARAVCHTSSPSVLRGACPLQPKHGVESKSLFPLLRYRRFLARCVIAPTHSTRGSCVAGCNKNQGHVSAKDESISFCRLRLPTALHNRAQS
jgi:hypothetical protein